MEILTEAELSLVNGGINLDGYRTSTNVEDHTLAGYIDKYGVVMGNLYYEREQLEALAQIAERQGQ